MQTALKIIRATNAPPVRPTANGTTAKKDGGGFDLSAYLTSMNSGPAGTLLDAAPRREVRAEETFLILLRGQKVGDGEDVPGDWTSSVVMKIPATTTFAKMREQFLIRKGYESEIVLAWKGTRLVHGCAGDVGLKDQDVIGTLVQLRGLTG
jgi:hypothetical protein